MGFTDLQAARQYYQEREARRRAEREVERQRWLQRSRQVISSVAARYPAVRRVHLFGSVVQPGRFRPDSDIDIAVECDSLEVESLLWRDLERELGRTVDLRPLAGVLVEVVTREGEQVYGHKVLILVNSIRRDLEAIGAIYDELERHPLTAKTQQETLIVVAYYLHNLYSAFENIFQNIAALFENSVDEVGRWQAQLLERMRLDVMPLRPAVIDDTAYDSLDELRRFRHLFRHAYGVKLDAPRLQLVMHKALSLKGIYVSQFERFINFLEGLKG